MNAYLIISGNSVIGQQIMESIQRNHQEKKEDYTIIATTSSDRDVPLAHKTIHGIDLTDKSKTDEIVSSIQKDNTQLDYLFYIFAKGTVGMPIDKVTEEDIADAIDLSAKTMVTLQQKLNPKMCISISGFVWLPSLLRTYGAMIYAKYFLEDIAVSKPDNFKTIRVGFFNSPSSRGIFILTYRSVKSQEYFDDWKKDMRESGKGFKDFFVTLNNQYEMQEYQDRFSEPYRPTNITDIQSIIKKVITQKTKPIVNLLGPWQWEEDKMSDKWPKHLLDRKEKLTPENFYT